MASVALSEAEKVYIVHGVQEDLRVDGRGCDDYRCVEVETDVVSNTSGSARVKLGHTDILVGVKAEMGTPKLEKPNEGYLEFFVDWYVPSSLLCQAPGNAGGGLGIGPAFVLISQAGPHFTRLKKEDACQATQHTTQLRYKAPSVFRLFYRCVEVETDVVSNTSGSARVKLLQPESRLWYKKVETLGKMIPSEGQKDSSYICIRVDQPEGTVKPVRSSASATPEFEGRGGDDLGTEIANTLYRIFNKSSIDLKSLCVSPREHCWVLYVDVLLLECGGNLFDAISIAVKAALFNTRYNAYAKLIDCTIVKPCLRMHREMDAFTIPRVRVLEDEEGSKDIELSDDPYDCIQLSVENVPCIVTLCKIGCRHVVDATLQEEACSLASLLVSVTSKGVVTCVRKVGKGSLDPESIFEMLETGKRVGKVLHASLQSILHKEESLGPKRQKVGFLG